MKHCIELCATEYRSITNSATPPANKNLDKLRHTEVIELEASFSRSLGSIFGSASFGLLIGLSDAQHR